MDYGRKYLQRLWDLLKLMCYLLYVPYGSFCMADACFLRTDCGYDRLVLEEGKNQI